MSSITSQLLGKTDFIDEIKEKYLSGKEKSRDMPTLKELTKTSLKWIIKAAQDEFRGKPELARKAVLYLSHQYRCRPLREIGEEFVV